jgi:hypothetical protein
MMTRQRNSLPLKHKWAVWRATNDLERLHGHKASLAAPEPFPENKVYV